MAIKTQHTTWGVPPLLQTPLENIVRGLVNQFSNKKWAARYSEGHCTSAFIEGSPKCRCCEGGAPERTPSRSAAVFYCA